MFFFLNRHCINLSVWWWFNNKDVWGKLYDQLSKRQVRDKNCLFKTFRGYYNPLEIQDGDDKQQGSIRVTTCLITNALTVLKVDWRLISPLGDI